jgi:hypothetical protein
MKKSFVIVVCSIFLCGLGFSISQAATLENNTGPSDPKGQGTGIQAAAPGCYIADTAYGVEVTTVYESTPVIENMYWAQHEANSLPYKNVEFILKFRTDDPKASPLKPIKQVFKFSPASNTTIGSPFGVQYWGGNAIIGPARLTVKSTRPSGTVKICTYDFTVAVNP